MLVLSQVKPDSYKMLLSLFVADVVEGDKVTLIPRPRRFGKTPNLTILKVFFEMDEPKNRELFRGLKIEQGPEAMAYFGGYPTIYISLKDIRAENWDTVREMLNLKWMPFGVGFWLDE